MQVLMVVFDILASHHRMLMWHESALESLLTESAEPKAATPQQDEAGQVSSSSHAENQTEDQAGSDGGSTKDERPPSNEEKEAATEPQREQAGDNMPLDRRYVTHQSFFSLLVHICLLTFTLSASLGQLLGSQPVHCTSIKSCQSCPHFQLQTPKEG